MRMLEWLANSLTQGRFLVEEYLRSINLGESLLREVGVGRKPSWSI